MGESFPEIREAVRKAVCDDTVTLVESLGGKVLGVVPSPISGGDGNAEYLIGAELS